MTILEIGHKKSVFDLIGLLEKTDNCKGIHFCRIEPVSMHGTLKIIFEDYLAPLQHVFVPEPIGRTYVFSHLSIPQRLEHLLQIIRTNFPGRSFDEIFIENHGNVIKITAMPEVPMWKTTTCTWQD